MSDSKRVREAPVTSQKKRIASAGALVAVIAVAVALAALADGARANPAQRPIVFSRALCASGGCDFGVQSRAIYAIDRIGFPPKRLTPPTLEPEEPSLAPDGRHLVFANRFKLWLIGVDGHGARQITRGTGVDTEPDWSPDGQRIVFRGNTPRGDFDLFLVRPDGSGRLNLTRNPNGVSATQPTWAPDGKRIAFIRKRFSTGGDYLPAGSGIYSIRPDGSGLKRVAGGEPSAPAWSPDGRPIAFERYETGSGTHIWLMNANGSGQRQLTRGDGADLSPAWSPDGKRIVFVRNGQITVVRPDGTHIKQLTKVERGTAVSAPDW